MSPNFPLSNATNSAGANPVLLGDFDPRSGAVEDFQHLSGGEGGSAVSLASCRMPGIVSVIDVVGLRAESEVIEINAGRVVTEVPDDFPIGDAAVGSYPYESMDLPRVSAYAKSAMSESFTFADPEYTAGRVRSTERRNALVDCSARRPRISNSGEFIRIEVIEVHAPLITPN